MSIVRIIGMGYILFSSVDPNLLQVVEYLTTNKNKKQGMISLQGMAENSLQLNYNFTKNVFKVLLYF